MENDEGFDNGADWPAAAATDVESIDAIVAALYEAISFEPPGLPEWDRLRSLFHPEGRLVPPAGDDGRAPVLTVEEFIENSTRFIQEGELGERGFHESELGRRTERFGKVAHAFSAYASRYTADDPEPFSRGINSIQLLREGERWWVLSIAWDVETPESPIPEEYLIDR